MCDQSGSEFSVEPYAIVISKLGKIANSRGRSLFPIQQPALSMLVIPQVELKQASLVESLEMLKQQAVKLTGGAIKINFVKPTSQSPSITLNLRGIPFMEALRYICDLTHTKFSVEQFAIAISDVEASKTTSHNQR
jgi:hypothetical protein